MGRRAIFVVSTPEPAKKPAGEERQERPAVEVSEAGKLSERFWEGAGGGAWSR